MFGGVQGTGVNTPSGIKITGLLNAMCAVCSVMFVVAFLIPRQSVIVALLGRVETSCRVYHNKLFLTINF